MYRIVKVLNHNAVLAVNAEDGKECLLMGKGIGFGKKVSEHVEPGEDARIYTLQASGERGQAGEIVKSIDPEFLEIANLVGGLLGILLLLLPFLGLLAVCVIYLMFDIIEGFRKRLGLP